MGNIDLERAAGDYNQCQRWLEIHQNWRSQQLAQRPLVDKLVSFIGKRVGVEFPEPYDPELETLLEARQQADENLGQEIRLHDGIHAVRNIIYLYNGEGSRINPVFIIDYSTLFEPLDENSPIWSTFEYHGSNRTAVLELGRHDVFGYQTRKNNTPRVLVPHGMNLRVPVTNLAGETFGFIHTTNNDFKRGVISRQTVSIQED